MNWTISGICRSRWVRRRARLWPIANTPTGLARMLSKLSQPGRTLKFCHEADLCGYGIQRQLSLAGHDAWSLHPSCMPTIRHGLITLVN